MTDVAIGPQAISEDGSASVSGGLPHTCRTAAAGEALRFGWHFLSKNSLYDTHLLIVREQIS